MSCKKTVKIGHPWALVMRGGARTWGKYYVCDLPISLTARSRWLLKVILQCPIYFFLTVWFLYLRYPLKLCLNLSHFSSKLIHYLCVFWFSFNSLFNVYCFPGGASGREPACPCMRLNRHEFNPWVWEIPWSGAWQSTPVVLLGKFHGQRSLAGYSP